MGAALETACESVAGDIRFIERRGTVGRDASLKALLASTRLRFMVFAAAWLTLSNCTTVCVNTSTQQTLPHFIYIARAAKLVVECWEKKSTHMVFRVLFPS